jgi:hypothetical protein
MTFWENRTMRPLTTLPRLRVLVIIAFAEALDLLTPISGGFTEGFDTPVRQDAKALLDQLARYLLY